MLLQEQFDNDKDLIEESKRIFKENDTEAEFFTIEIENSVTEKIYKGTFAHPTRKSTIDYLQVVSNSKAFDKTDKAIEYCKRWLVYPDPKTFDKWADRNTGHISNITNALLEIIGFSNSKENIHIKNE